MSLVTIIKNSLKSAIGDALYALYTSEVYKILVSEKDLNSLLI